MTRAELIEYLDLVLSHAADGPPEGPRPQGTFVGEATGPLTGLRLVALDGAVWYVAVLGAQDFRARQG